MFTNVAILASTERSERPVWLDQLRLSMRNPMRFRVKEFFSMGEINSGLTSFQFDVLILRIPKFETHHLQTLEKIRRRFPKAGILTLVTEVEPIVRSQTREVFRHKLLTESLELKDVPAIVETFSAGNETASRVHPRVRRADACEVTSEGEGVMAGNFIDFAQMGARLIVSPKNPLRKNMQVVLQYPSSTEPGKIHKIAASVRWVAYDRGMVGTIVNGPRQIVGLRFIAAL